MFELDSRHTPQIQFIVDLLSVKSNTPDHRYSMPVGIIKMIFIKCFSRKNILTRTTSEMIEFS
jgi:hypothetical protein